MAVIDIHKYVHVGQTFLECTWVERKQTVNELMARVYNYYEQDVDITLTSRSNENMGSCLLNVSRWNILHSNTHTTQHTHYPTHTLPNTHTHTHTHTQYNNTLHNTDTHTRKNFCCCFLHNIYVHRTRITDSVRYFETAPNSALAISIDIHAGVQLLMKEPAAVMVTSEWSLQSDCRA